MNISLTPDLDRFVHEKVRKGNYSTPADVVQDGLRLLQECDQLQLNQLRQEIAVGINQLDQGEGQPWDAKAVKAEGRRLLRQRKTS
jgi:antitoxin ParD1/3/4